MNYLVLVKIIGITSQLRMNWRVNKPFTLNEQTRGFNLIKEAVKYAVTRRGVLTWTRQVSDTLSCARVPELENTRRSIFFVHGSFASSTDRKLDKEPGMTLAVYQCRPESQGSIHIGGEITLMHQNTPKLPS